MIIANEIKNAWEVIKKGEFKSKGYSVRYCENESFILIDESRLEKVIFTKEQMLAIADWVQCLFIDDGQYEYRNNIEG